MQFHTRPLKEVVFCGCQTSSAIVSNKCSCVGQKLPRNDLRTAKRWTDQWPSKYIFFFIFVDETSWREYKSQCMSDHSKPKFIMELLREVTGTAEVLVHHSFLNFSNCNSCKYFFARIERQKRYRLASTISFIYQFQILPSFQKTIIVYNFYKGNQQKFQLAFSEEHNLSSA